jgi:hypothetical protein
VLLWLHLAGTLGAVSAAYAAQNARRDTAWWFLLCMVTAGGIAVLLMLLGALGPLVQRPPLEMLETAGSSFLLYLPIVFVLEEVTFRGACSLSGRAAPGIIGGVRRRENLLVPGGTHAFMDAVRNAICSTII